MYGVPQYKFHNGPHPAEFIPTAGTVLWGKKKSKNLKGLGNQQALPILAFS